jgi:hypothetical protein
MTITITQISTALGQHLEGMADCPPIAWPNKSADHALPYLRFRHDPVSRSNASLAKDIPADQTGLALVTVVSRSDTFANEAEGLAEDIAQRFTEGTRIAAGSGQVLISLAEPVAGFTDPRGNWNVPVRIRYRTE